MLLKEIKTEAEVSLVDLRPQTWPHPLFVTITPDPSVLLQVYRSRTLGMKTKRVSLRLPYGSCRQIEQYEYCLRIVKSAYNFHEDTKIFGTWELNKSGNVHLHLILSCPTIRNSVELDIARRDVKNSELVMDNLKKRFIDRMDSIVFVNDSLEARFGYLTKDITTNLGIFPYYCTPDVKVFDD